MGVAPPPDAPPPDVQAGVDAEIGFEPSPGGFDLCGFGFPLFIFNVTFRLPPFPPFPFPPQFNFFIGLNCDLSNPLDAEFSFGGGRVGQPVPDEFEEAEANQ